MCFLAGIRNPPWRYLCLNTRKLFNGAVRQNCINRKWVKMFTLWKVFFFKKKFLVGWLVSYSWPCILGCGRLVRIPSDRQTISLNVLCLRYNEQMGGVGWVYYEYKPVIHWIHSCLVWHHVSSGRCGEETGKDSIVLFFLSPIVAAT